jgi:hypothetical protein
MNTFQKLASKSWWKVIPKKKEEEKIRGNEIQIHLIFSALSIEEGRYLIFSIGCSVI